MVFAHDTDVALQTAAALVNTAVGAFPDDEGDTLETTDQLRDFYVGWAWTGRFDGDSAELGQVRALRPRLRAVWAAADDDEAASSRTPSPAPKAPRADADEADAAPLLCTLPPTCCPPHGRPTPLASSRELEAHYARVHAHVCAAPGCAPSGRPASRWHGRTPPQPGDDAQAVDRGRPARRRSSRGRWRPASWSRRRSRFGPGRWWLRQGRSRSRWHPGCLRQGRRQPWQAAQVEAGEARRAGADGRSHRGRRLRSPW